MKRIGILTAGGDTPAMNATIQGAVVRANQLRLEIFGLIKGFNSLFNPRVPHVHLNPLYQEIPEVDPTKGGTMIGSSRDYVDPSRKDELDLIAHRLQKLGIEGLICVGGDGTLNGLQPLAERLPTVLAPKTIDNDLGLNYPDEPDKWVRVPEPNTKEGYRYEQRESHAVFDLDIYRELRHAWIRNGRVRVSQWRRTNPDNSREPSSNRDHRGDGPAFRLYRTRIVLRTSGYHPCAGTSS